jgi:hypothetical protein
MVHMLVAWAGKAVAAAYGLFALSLAILYSLSRSDTWRRSTEKEQQGLHKGTTHLLPEYIGVSTNLTFYSMHKAMVPLNKRR